MRRTVLALSLLVITALLSVGAPAFADTAYPCQSEIEGLVAATEGATSLSAKAQGSLVVKAASAGDKAAAGKYADALQKLGDYGSTIDALNAAPKAKISPADYQALRAQVDAASSCVQGLSTL